MSRLRFVWTWDIPEKSSDSSSLFRLNCHLRGVPHWQLYIHVYWWLYIKVVIDGCILDTHVYPAISHYIPRHAKVPSNPTNLDSWSPLSEFSEMLPLQCAVSPKEAEPAPRGWFPSKKKRAEEQNPHSNSMGDIAGIECWEWGRVLVVYDTLVNQKGISREVLWGRCRSI